MGCISSKNARSDSPPRSRARATSSRHAGQSNGNHHSVPPAPVPVEAVFGPLEKIKEEPEGEVEEVEEEEEKEKEEYVTRRIDFKDSNSHALKREASERKVAFSIKFGRLTESEHVASGWPAWLSAVAGEAIDGWLPLKSDAFQRLEKIGQGTYSDVYRAREVETGRMVALKKVKFDNFEPESVKFMAREILILRKLDHPNIMKLEGIITSRLSCNLYLVFEYMEHDLAGLLSCPDIKFTESQIKCYMKQLLSGVDYCHRRGIMHRDIKTSNVLINNEGVLKIGDFGLANFLRPKNREPLTSRVVTLWYRPPELLLGATSYGETVDLWSVGCVFAEIFLGRPLFKGRTEVEQLHKIFKLCGSPADEFWRKSRLPLATMFRPQHPYESTLRERCREFPKSAVSLIETLLSIEPYNRGTSYLALESEYFHTRPFACEPSSMPQYPPNKEMDAKFREDVRRKKTSRVQSGSKNTRLARKISQESSDFCKVVPREENEANIQVAPRSRVASTNVHRRSRGGAEPRTTLNQPADTMSEASQTTEVSNVTSTRSVPVQGTQPVESSAKRRKQPDVFTRLHSHQTGRRKISLEPSDILHVYDVMDSDMYANDDSSTRVHRLRREHSYLNQTDDSSNHESQETSTRNGHRRTRSRDRLDISRQTGQASHRSRLNN